MKKEQVLFVYICFFLLLSLSPYYCSAAPIFTGKKIATPGNIKASAAKEIRNGTNFSEVDEGFLKNNSATILNTANNNDDDDGQDDDDLLLVLCFAASSFAMLVILAIFSILLYKLFAKKPESSKTLIITKTLSSSSSSSSSSDYQPVDCYDTTPVDYYNLRVKELIGRGRFGYVHRGVISIRDTSSKRILKYSQNVAVKFAASCNNSGNNSLNSRKTTFLNELQDDESPASSSLLKHERVIFAHIGRHYAVVALLTSGTIAQQRRFCLVMELCSGGSLLDYLRRSRATYPYDTIVSPPSIELYKELLQITWQIASGMKYIHDRGVIHRDLAARNILLTAKHSPKISDFGHARYVTSYDGFYRCNPDDRNIPWTISAPEWLTQRCYYFKSDTWSFGVLLWEVLRLGDEPYHDWNKVNASHTDVLIERFKAGRRLAPPTWATDNIVHILANCWAYDHTRRPLFDELTRKIQSALFHAD